MSIVSNNSNYNKVSVKTDSIVEMIQELSKLGVFKEKRKPRRAKKATTADIRQEGDIGPGYTQPTQIRVEADTQALTQNQIEDIQRKNDALVAGLRAEVQRQRQEDLAGIGYGFRTFRSAQEAGAGVYDPFKQSATVEDIPDVIEERFGETLNIGGPEAVEKRQTTVFAGEEGDLPPGIAFAEIGEEPRIKIREPIREKTGGGTRKTKSLPLREAVTTSYGLSPIPSEKGSKIVDVLRYYKNFINETQYPIDESIFTSKEKMIRAMNDIADEIGKTL